MLTGYRSVWYAANNRISDKCHGATISTAKPLLLSRQTGSQLELIWLEFSECCTALSVCYVMHFLIDNFTVRHIPIFIH